MTEAAKLMDDATHREIYVSLQNLETLPDAAKKTVSDSLRTFLMEKRRALAKVRDLPGNAQAYFHIGMIFFWDMRRIHLAGTGEEKMETITTVLQSKDAGNIQGYAKITAYYLKRYLELEPNGEFAEKARPLLAELAPILDRR